MANLNTYIKNYGDISFTVKPFSAEDSAAMCYMFYMPMELGVSSDFNDEPIPYADAARKVFAARGNKHKPVGLVLIKNISKTMMQMVDAKRYNEMKVVACTDNFGKNPAVQFNAGTFLLPDGTIVVLFRGTDDTLIGWEEDLNIMTEDDIPSHQLATAYLAEVANRFDGDIIVCGHSKGGYVAQYAVLNSPKEIRDRIKTLYNNDGPGFADYQYLSSEAYQELLSRYVHIVPHSSLIGMMLAHDDDYKVVKSNKLTGPMQHELSTWQFEGDHLKYVDDITKMGKITDLAFHQVVSNITDEQSKALGKTLNVVFEGMGQRGLLDVKSHPIASVKGAKKAWKATDEETKKAVKSAMKDAKKAVKDASRTVKKGEFKTVHERLGN